MEYLIYAGVAIGSSLLTTWFTWLLRRKHESRQLWAQYAAELTRLHSEAQSRHATATATTIPVLAPVKVFRELLLALEAFGKTGKWPMGPEELGLLNISFTGPPPGPVTG